MSFKRHGFGLFLVVLLAGLVTVLCQQTEADDPNEHGAKCYDYEEEINCQTPADQMCDDYGYGAFCYYCTSSIRRGWNSAAGD
jgi:hypothetical protein